jgi:hypothetical protein
VNGLGRALMVDIVIMKHMSLDGHLASFSLLLQDLSRQSAGEAARNEIRTRCDKIVQTLMPLEVYSELNMRSTIFSSKSATVISVELTGLLENVISYSPSQVLEVISSVYDLFDEVTASHSCVRRVNSLGNEILACCGLFDCANQSHQQVEQAALTCIEFVSQREEINEKLAVELDIKCGIAFGGPLIGDVLNRGAPKFDLTGTIVNEAIMIRRDAPPGVIYVNEGVQKLLNPSFFECKEVQVLDRNGSRIFEIELQMNE